jgi:uncharacterized membrane protein YdfJ with MMPL/SSD domain
MPRPTVSTGDVFADALKVRPRLQENIKNAVETLEKMRAELDRVNKTIAAGLPDSIYQETIVGMSDASFSELVKAREEAKKAREAEEKAAIKNL